MVKDRGIPSWRDELDLLLTNLELSTPIELLNKSFGLSLSDQYWIKPYDSNIEYKDINFFEHDFRYSEFKNITFSTSNLISSKISFDELLHKYIDITHMSERRIKKLCILFLSRINKLKKYIEEKK